MKRKSNILTGTGRVEVYNSVRSIEDRTLVPVYRGSTVNAHERISEFNADIATESFFSTPLTDYAVGYNDTADLDRELEFFAPEVPVTPRFEYAMHDNAEAFLSDGGDDERPAKSDFKDVEYTESKVNETTANRGLQITLDMDKIRGRSDWEEHYTAKLLKRIKRNSLRRAITMLSAAANNTAKTWDVTAGKDPDMDVLQELLLGAVKSGIKASRVGYGDTAFTKRLLSHRAQDTNGGAASAGMSLAEINPLFPALRSSHELSQRPSPPKQIPSNNGYMRLAGDGAQVSLQIALFRFEDKSPLLAIAWGDLEEADFTHVTLFREKEGKMIIADRSILPVPDSPNHRFELPRHGRTVIIRNGKVLSKWTWDGKRFAKG